MGVPGVDDDDPLSADMAPDGGVDEVLEDVLGLVVELDEDGGVLELDVEPELGVVDGELVEDEDDDFDGDGLTTGGDEDDVGLLVPDSRWQPAIPSARPVQSNVTNALLMVISTFEVEGRDAVSI